MEIWAAKRLNFDPCERNTQTNEIQPVKIRPVPCERNLNRAIFSWPWNKKARTKKQKQNTDGNFIGLSNGHKRTWLLVG